MLNVAPVEWLHFSSKDVACHVTGNCHGVLGRGEWWSVGMFEACELLCRGSLLDGQGQLVYARIYSVVANNLCSVQATVFRREGDLQAHLQASGVVAGM